MLSSVASRVSRVLIAKNTINKCITTNFIRNQSSDTKQLVKVEVNEKTGIATVALNRAPVNSLNLELLQAISKSLEDLEDTKCRGIILTSTSDTVFSAGLDITEMYKPDQTRLRDFWTSLQDTWLLLFGSALPTVAFINGHSPAGGCLLAMCCEYRVMMPNFTIGLNETKLGIVAPSWFMSTMNNVIPRRQAELALTRGTLFTTDEALKVGLIDEIATSKEEGLKKCEDFLKSYAKVNPMARAMTKQLFRMKDIQALEDNRSQDVNIFVNTINSQKVQQSLELYIQSLKNKK